MPLEDYQPVEDAFREGRIDAQDDATLRKYLLALSNQAIENDRLKHRDIIRGLTINHILLQRHIAALDAKNTRTTCFVVVLTVASLVGTASQTWYGYKADRRTESESTAIEAKRQKPEPESEARSQPTPQATGQAFVKPIAASASAK